MDKTRKPYNILLTEQERAALDAEAARMGVSAADVVRMYLRQLARKQVAA